MVEVIIATLLIGIVLVGALTAVSGIWRSWATAERQEIALSLARQLMAEILQQRYEEPVDAIQFGVEASESGSVRTAWDDVDDYHNWSSAPQDSAGTPLPGLEDWTRSVAVSWVQLDDPSMSSASDQGLKRITVTVIDPGGNTVVLDAYRSRWGGLETPLDKAATLQTLVNSQIEVGGRSIYGAATIQNHAEGP